MCTLKAFLLVNISEQTLQRADFASEAFPSPNLSCSLLCKSLPTWVEDVLTDLGLRRMPESFLIDSCFSLMSLDELYEL